MSQPPNPMNQPIDVSPYVRKVMGDLLYENAVLQARIDDLNQKLQQLNQEVENLRKQSLE